jgi:hypothetical protein
MRGKSSTVAPEQEVVELIIGLLDDFEEHAEIIIRAKQHLKATKVGSDEYYQALAQIEAWMNGLTAIIPGILEELDRLDENPEYE